MRDRTGMQVWGAWFCLFMSCGPGCVSIRRVGACSASSDATVAHIKRSRVMPPPVALPSA